ncbi:MAG TPA: stage II sporulation protein M [Pyrinomonadaceae bacterium]|nr:stage II sporulation protein M [Pyrinomonadaceae bacterium]
MSSNRFIQERKGAWQRLEDLLTLLDRMSLRRLHREEVRELGRIYRRTSSDLAIARAESRDPRLVNYLNSLVIRAHGRIYRAGALEGGARVRLFFARDFPRAFRRTWRHTALAFVVFAAFFLAGFLGTWRDTEFSDLAGVTSAWRAQNTDARVRWWERLNEANQVGGAAIMTNNIQVMFYAFAFGALIGLGTLYIMAFNGASIGAVLALTYRAGFGHELLAFMAGHGVIELTCIFIAGGAGLLVGSAILFPGDLSRLDALRLRGRDSIQLIVGCIPLLVLAGIIEGFISPAPISPAFKYAVAAATGVALYTYLLLAGREEAGEGSTTAIRAL